MKTATAPTFPAVVPEPDAIEREVLDSYDGIRKLTEAIEDQEHKRKERELDLARSFVKEARSAVDVNRATQANDAWRADDDLAAKRIEALTNIRAKVIDLLTCHKTENPTAVKAAYATRLEALDKALAEKTAAATDIKEEKKRLEAEFGKAYQPAAGTPAAATPTPAKATQKS
jgi:hypothetical protein